MPHELDLDSWHRRHHFEFFKDYEQPFFNLCAEVDVTRLLEVTRAGQHSFFLACLYLSLEAANGIEPFRYRLRGNGVTVFDVIHGGSTILRQDQTFGFAYFDYEADFAVFHAAGSRILEQTAAAQGPLEDRPERDDLIHYSVIPWVSFSSFSHARRLPASDSTPKIVFGKHHDSGGAAKMPVSVEVHHALMDGLEMGQFFESFQSLLEDPAALTR